MLRVAPVTEHRIRDAAPSDVEALGRVHVESWTHTYEGIIPSAELARTNLLRSKIRFSRALAGRASSDRLMVLEDPVDGVVGYVSVGPVRFHEYRGEIFELYLDPRHQGRGGGARLLSAGIWRLLEQRHGPVLVWALAANHRARRFYERQGGVPLARGSVVVGGRRLEKVAYGWPESPPYPVWG